jgi:hypothetical protein
MYIRFVDTFCRYTIERMAKVLRRLHSVVVQFSSLPKAYLANLLELRRAFFVFVFFGWNIQPNIYMIYVKKKPTHFSRVAEGLKLE